MAKFIPMAPTTPDKATAVSLIFLPEGVAVEAALEFSEGFDGFKTDSGSLAWGSLWGEISPRGSTLGESVFHSYFTTRIRIFTLLNPEHFRDVGQVDPKQD